MTAANKAGLEFIATKDEDDDENEEEGGGGGRGLLLCRVEIDFNYNILKFVCAPLFFSLFSAYKNI
jgi:hypothetical protein